MNRNILKTHLPLIALLVLLSCSQKKKSSITNTTSESTLQQENNDTSTNIDGVFNIPEIHVTSSPSASQSFSVNADEKIIDYDVSPAGPIVAILTTVKENYMIKFWQIDQNKISDSCKIEGGFAVTSIAWHPRASSLFLIGSKDKQYHVLKVEKNPSGWNSKSIFSSANQLRRLVPCPRPFIVGKEYADGKRSYSYRLFLGMSTDNNSFRTVSITETGKRLYQVIGPKKSISRFEDADAEPSTMEADWALPIAFHPAGHQLIWEDNKNNFYVADYDRMYWNKSQRISANTLTGGTITPTPNGLGLLHWKKDKPGIGLYLLSDRKENIQIPEMKFIATPSSVPDGKGIVGLTKTNERYTLNYVPINVPLPDVINAWMYVESAEESNLFQKNSGLFRTKGFDQLYKLYETENYYCAAYDQSTPTRPYMVTTDVFWELFASAYQGIFIVKERENAIPNFWKFINESDQYYKKTSSKSSWSSVFATLVELNTGKTTNAELDKIKKAEGSSYSEVLKKDYDYSELKPRGHYTSTDDMKNYFMAFKYFTTGFKEEPNTMKELNGLPAEVKQYAIEWIKNYMGFISPSRAPLVWSEIKNVIPSYNKNPGKGVSLFPLSWGFDNEILYSTVYHQDLPAEQQIKGPEGPRMLPSGLDLAAVFENGFASSLLESDYKRFPPLKKVIDNLKSNFKTNGKGNFQKDNLYDKWINALAVQWVDTVVAPDGKTNNNIWQAKRLQTGLASWATLRHATVLVNERTAAECGEGGFEDILLRAPRGYVEPDPYTFGAIADLFETAIKYIPESIKETPNSDGDEKITLYDGIIKRLKQTAADAKMFQGIAEKEKRGEAITSEEYESILYLGRIVEHYFLIYNSLANKDFALSTPDPMAKIVDVAGGGVSPYLMSAVGYSFEWDNVIPFYGRREIVKGSVYSYYEFPSEQPLNDDEWRKRVSEQSILSWLNPFTTERTLSSPAPSGY